MRNSLKNLMVLLIVFSTVTAKSADSIEVAAFFKIVPEEDEKVRVIYQATKRQDVTLQLLDSKDQVIYSEGLSTDGFMKRFDLAYLPVGEYRLEVKSEDQTFGEDITVGDISGFNFTLTPQTGREVTLVGSHKDGKNATLFILDEFNEVVYQEQFKDTKQVHKVYNFKSLRGDNVSFVLYHDDQVIKEQKIEF